ncbi:MAG TPA: ParB/RepB/Spo0J family partition protein [Burkholderiales bacterium]|nr:ParB/RepB/Spo0J family partition protein [Burkholderiales bacterium]
MVKLKGLGRGLDALLATGNEAAPVGETLQNLSVTALQPGKYQPRSRMDHASLAELAESIKAQGVMQPILARPVAAGRFEIIAGERRWRASQIAGLTEVPVLVREVPDNAALAMALIENIQREALNPLEQAHGIQRLIDEFKMTHQDAAHAVGYSRSAVTNLLRLTNLAKPVQDLLMEEKLDMGHARALLALPPAKQIEIGHAVAHRGLSVRETERLVQHLLNPPVKRASPRVSRDVQRLQEEISDLLGAVVKLAPGAKGRGKLTIEYSNLDQLEGILNKLRR